MNSLPYRLLLLVILYLHHSYSFCLELHLGAENSWPPFSNQNGEGISKAIVERAFELQNIQINIEVLPYARAVDHTARGLLNGCWNVTRQDSTENQFIFGNTPLLAATASYFYPSNSTLDYTSAKHIADNTRIGIIINYEYGDEFDRQRHRFQLHAVKNQSQIIQLLINNRIDMAIMFDEVALYTLQQLKLSKVAIQKGNINHIGQVYVAFNKSNKNSSAYAKALDEGLKTLHETGEYEQLFTNSRNKMLQIQ